MNSRPVWLTLAAATVAAALTSMVQFSPSRAAQIDKPLVVREIDPSDDLAAWPLLVPAGAGAEARLLQAYVALGSGQGRKAMELASSLVQDFPEFGLAQMLYGDLLAAKAGHARVFGAAEADLSANGERKDLVSLREQAMRRLAALRERPPADHVPRELVSLPQLVKYAVAVDAERSRLYLFANGPDGPVLEKDYYVSLGKQGIAKRAEGDARTPLGVYWVTNALQQNLLDERFGKAALGINYPNALDKQLGRTGTGLFVHGVPPTVGAHGLWATDGCVALANDDVEELLKRLSVDDSPVVIAKSLEWVPRNAARQAAAEFRPAYNAWDEARRAGDLRDLQRWYDANAKVPRATTASMAARGDVSFVAWYGEDTPMMVVTSREPAKGTGEAVQTFRQYWAQQDGRWRIIFDGAIGATAIGR